MSRSTGSTTILFADMVDSMDLWKRKGDAYADAITAGFHKRISEIVVRLGGRVIKTIGDEVMSTFPAADQAANAACAIQQAMGDPIKAGPNESGTHVGVSVGFHFGPVIERHGDVFGDAVNLASRIASFAKGGQILTSQHTLDAMGSAARESIEARKLDRRKLKGMADEVDIIQLVWEAAGITELVKVRRPTRPSSGVGMILTIEGREQEVGPNFPCVTLGRASPADLIVDDLRASRIHAKVVFDDGRFILHDNSTNGSFVTVGSEDTMRVHHISYVLPNSGRINLWHDAADDKDLSIHFRRLSS